MPFNTLSKVCPLTTISLSLIFVSFFFYALSESERYALWPVAFRASLQPAETVTKLQSVKSGANASGAVSNAWRNLSFLQQAFLQQPAQDKSVSEKRAAPVILRDRCPWLCLWVTGYVCFCVYRGLIRNISGTSGSPTNSYLQMNGSQPKGWNRSWIDKKISCLNRSWIDVKNSLSHMHYNISYSKYITL